MTKDLLSLSNQELLELFLEELLASGLSEKTVKAYRAGISDFLEFIGDKHVSEVSRLDILRWRSVRLREGFPRRIRNSRRRLEEHEERRLRQATLHYYTIFLRAFFRWLGLDVEVPIVKMLKKTYPDVLSEEEVEKLLVAARDLLDLVILYLLLDTGLRAQELIGVKISDVDLDKGEIRVRRGKYGEERIVFLTSITRRILSEWLKIHGSNPDDRLVPLSYAGLYKRLKTLAKKAGVAPEKVRPHILRHTFATEALRRGMNLIALQRLLGHKDVKTTQIYTHLAVEDLRREYMRAFEKTIEETA